MIYKTKKNKLNNKKRNSKKGGSSTKSTHQLEQELTKCKEELQECRENLFLSMHNYDSRGRELELTREEHYKCIEVLQELDNDLIKCQEELRNTKDELERYRDQQSFFIVPQTG